MDGKTLLIGVVMLLAAVQTTESRRRAERALGTHRKTPRSPQLQARLLSDDADIAGMEVIFCGTPDRAPDVGTKGVGEIGLVGLAAAIGNAAHHATGRRLRSLPFTIERLF
ncbi:hypothetical protein [Streptomyces sp. NPDC052721]|uniref:hypothetical protein n=1 Tax=Streptomyces sp. NPDC052721 TaxID=3154955 RepID=UPI0034297DB2